VDIGAIEFIHRRLVALRDAGKAILLVSCELDEILGLADRILVMFDGRIVGEHGRLVRERWINNTAVPDPELLDAPGIGPVADANSMYAAVTAMRAFPLDKAGLLSVVLPVMLPMIVVFALQIPLKDLLLKLLTALA
jgi:energy-coupling factor transporter ATP-binding protein EcfA2